MLLKPVKPVFFWKKTQKRIVAWARMIGVEAERSIWIWDILNLANQGWSGYRV